ncbi:carbohydrate kinase family protein [Neptunitalea lumnitzerae]|uniref:Sugar kinase n=1 Tax=Neptunitalea lumnitzerae TaxID=2965509 RepID=A0ABQ5MGG2_9FLAO|nr:sugar kinase [Neptunitalea sp. Y10]GLB48514.1 sugar kinase [Neptunitalea sp. Y10]
MKTIDIISIGEILIDCIGSDLGLSLEHTTNFQRYLGGSPTNVAINAARLGLKASLVATCGKDGFGDFMLHKLQEDGVQTDYLRRSEEYPTSVIFVSKSVATPEFIPYREADCEIRSEQLSEAFIAQAKVYHTTSFALSKNPAQQTILEGAKMAFQQGVKLSIDINFSEKIWPNKEEATEVLGAYLAMNPLVKISEDDCYRFFGEHKTDAAIFEYFHAAGAATICYTKGKNGVVISDTTEGIYTQKAMEIPKVIDATGAGDAFWTGFLYGYIHNKTLLESVAIAQKLASVKLQNLGGLPKQFDVELIKNGK